MPYKENNNCPDDQLLLLLKQDNKVAFDMIYARYWQPLLFYITKAVANTDDAKDILQDIFISLWNRRSHLDDIESLKAYLFTAARYKALSTIKHNINKSNHLSSLGNFIEPASDSINEQIHADELGRLINTEVDKLPAKMKEVFILSRQENLSHKSIAEKLMISDKTVKKQINNVLRHLRLMLTDK